MWKKCRNVSQHGKNAGNEMHICFSSGMSDNPVKYRNVSQRGKKEGKSANPDKCRNVNERSNQESQQTKDFEKTEFKRL